LELTEVNDDNNQMSPAAVERPRTDVDIVCVGFGPAMGGFLTTLARGLVKSDGSPVFESAVAPGLPPQVLCYERADDLGFGVSGVVTRARGIRATLPDLDPAQIPMAAAVRTEKLLYLLDPIGASRRSRTLRLGDWLLCRLKWPLRVEHDAVEVPWSPGFLHKTGGLVLSLGQFMQWIGAQAQSTGAVQIWPATPVARPIIENNAVVGVQLLDQGTDRQGKPEAAFLPGMEVRARLTVVGDGPFGPVAQQLDQHFGFPQGHGHCDWALGMKMVVDLPSDTPLEPGLVLHTFGFPEPELFGFLYVHPERVASFGIFVPSSFPNPVRTAYRYLQHWMLHPYLWRYLKGARLRSWGAKSLEESARRGEPFLVGNGYARIGEGSGATNVLTNSGVDEAWTTGAQLAKSVLDLLKSNRPFTQENLQATYVHRRRNSWLEQEARMAQNARGGFRRGFLTGLIGMALAGFTRGRLSLPSCCGSHRALPTIEDFYAGRIPAEVIQQLRKDCAAQGLPLHQVLMDRTGWPAIPYDGQLLVSQQDVLLLGGKVQAASGYADHVVFHSPGVCRECATRLCIEMCSGQAITATESGVPAFDREKCIHCGACLWNCTRTASDRPSLTNVEFRAGVGGLHSAEN
jgi:electron-transferring-flavoprotein dehydrogenase